MTEANLSILLRGVPAWNAWRQQNPDVVPDLRGVDLSAEALFHHRPAPPFLKFFHGGTPEEPTEEFHVDLRGVDFSRTLLIGAVLSGADLTGANLTKARLADVDFTGATLDNCDLTGADLNEAKLVGTSVRHSYLRGCSLHQADLWRTCLAQADLTGADLTEARILFTDFTGATLIDCKIYGAALWDVDLTDAKQSNIVVEPDLTVDHLALAQIFHLVRGNTNVVVNFIDTLNRKVVLLLGRFGPYKAHLDAVRAALRERGYHSLMYDVPESDRRSGTEMVSALAHLAHFIVVDISEPKSVPQELQRIVPQMTSVPVVPIIQKDKEVWSMFVDLRVYDWVLDIVRYKDTDDLLARLDKEVIAVAEAKASALHAKLAALRMGSK